MGANEKAGTRVGKSPGTQAGGLGDLLAGLLDVVTAWGSGALYAATILLLFYLLIAGLAWRKSRTASHEARVERLRNGGLVLEVIVPSGSRADAAVMSRLLRQLWDHLATPAQSGALRRAVLSESAQYERSAISLEIIGKTDGVGFYIWLPAAWEPHATLIETLRDLIRAHYPGCRVRLLETDHLQREVYSIAKEGKEGDLLWVDLALQADSRYPIGSGTSGNSRSAGTSGSGAVRAGVGGAAADTLGGLLSLLAAEPPSLPLIGVQIVVSANAEATGDVRQQILDEKAQLQELSAQYGRRSLGREHDERVLALEEKDDEYGYATQVRLFALATGGKEAARRAEMRLGVLLKSYRLYNRTTAGVAQGFVEKARGRAKVRRGMNTWEAGPVLGRWQRTGLGVARWLRIMRRARPDILNCDELAGVYHYPHEGLEKIGTVQVVDRTYLPVPAFAMATSQEIEAGGKVLIGTVEEDMPTRGTGLPNASVPSSPMALSVGGQHGLSSSVGVSDQAGRRGNGSSRQVVPSTVWQLVPAGKRVVGVTVNDLTRAMYLLGGMGSGKSGMLLIKIWQHLQAGAGVGLIDPKTDLYNEVMLRVPPEREKDVVLFDPSSVGRVRRVVGLNPLDARLVRELGAARVAAKTMDLIKKVMGASWDTAVRMKRFLQTTLIAVLEAEMAVGRASTLMSVYRCLKDEDGKGANSYRDSLLPHVTNPIVLDFWRVQFPAMGAQQRQSLDTVLTRIEKFVLDDVVRSFVAQPESTLNVRQIMDQNGIFLANITNEESKENQVFLGSIITNMFLLAAMSRRDVPQWGTDGQTLRPYFHLHLDEFQNFVATEAEDIETMLSMCRAFHLCLTMAHQYTGQLPQNVMDAISSNVQTMVLFGLQGPDAPRFSAMFPEVRSQDWLHLPQWHSYQRSLVNGRSTKGLYSAGPLNLPPLAANPGEDAFSDPQGASVVAYEQLAPAPGRMALIALAHDDLKQTERDRQARLYNLAQQLWHPSDQGEPWVVDVLSLLSVRDFEIYRDLRHRFDMAERNRLLSQPGLVRDKKSRIERLSALRVGTPQVEVDAWVNRMTRGDADMSPGPGTVLSKR